MARARKKKAKKKISRSAPARRKKISRPGRRKTRRAGCVVKLDLIHEGTWFIKHDGKTIGGRFGAKVYPDEAAADAGMKSIFKRYPRRVKRGTIVRA